MDFPSFNYKPTCLQYGPTSALPGGGFWSVVGFPSTAGCRGKHFGVRPSRLHILVLLEEVGVSKEMLFIFLSLCLPVSPRGPILPFSQASPQSRAQRRASHGASELTGTPSHSPPCSPPPVCTHPRVLRLRCILKTQVPWINTHMSSFTSALL